MAAGGVNMQITGDAAGLMSAQKKAALGQKEITDAFKRSAQEGRKFDSIAKGIATAVETYAQKFKRMGIEAEQAFKGGRISSEQYQKRIAQINGALDSHKGKLDEMVGAVGDFGKANDGVWDVKQITGYGTAIGVALALVTKFTSIVNDNLTRSAETLKSLAQTEAELNQIANQQMTLGLMKEQAKAISLESGVPLAATQALVFSAISEDFSLTDAGRLAMLGHTVDPVVSAGIAGRMPKIFNQALKEGEDPLTPMESMNVLIASAQRSPLKAAELARAIPTISQGAVRAGSSFEETAAIMSVVAEQGNPLQMATYMKGFALMASEMPALKGLGMLGAAKKLQEMSPEDRAEILKDSQERKIAYGFLTGEVTRQRMLDQREINEQARLATGTERSEISMAEARARADPDMQARAAEARATANEADAVTSRFGIESLKIDAVIKNFKAMADRGGMTAAAYTPTMWEMESMKFAGFGAEAIAQHGAQRLASEMEFGGEAPQGIGKIGSALRGIGLGGGYVDPAQQKLFQDKLTETFGSIEELAKKQLALLEAEGPINKTLQLIEGKEPVAPKGGGW